MNVQELRRKYLAFFESKGHLRATPSTLVPYDVAGNLDTTLLFNGSGMNQFKPYFRGLVTPPSKRLMSAQICLRTGDIEEVGDDSHLTLFEMLGNFSIGEYFKEQAVDFSWEFLTSTEWLGLGVKRLGFSIFEEDDEAFTFWSKHLEAAGIDPATRIFRLNEETNYWPAGAFSKGPPGPCGPNSEMFYWVSGEPPTGPYTSEDFLRDDEANNWIEIWNDVFITYDWQGELRDPARPDKGYAKQGMPHLPFLSIDTGMGLERTAVVLGGFKSVYDTDAFQPIFRKLEALKSGLKYESSAETTRAMRIVADHCRAATFCIAEGIYPGNSSRSYVLRRLIRRAILKGARVLGFDDLFLFELVAPISETLGDSYPYLVDKKALVEEQFRTEETLFRRTLKQGSELLTTWIKDLKGKELDGARAFDLYHTYGFPLEVTQEICAESGLTVDEEGYRVALQEAQELSRSANASEGPYVGAKLDLPKDLKPTSFLGYRALDSEAKVLACSLAGDQAVVILDQTPFYAKSGGQVGDTGSLMVGGSSYRVLDTTKSAGVFYHLVDTALPVGAEVEAHVDEIRRTSIRRHHTATHLLQAGLRLVLGHHVGQAGSEVDDQSLRFDFTHNKAMTPAEIMAVEEFVNQQVMAAVPVKTYEDIPVDQAKAMGAMALFGEKYGDKVRVVQVGGMSPDEPSVSRELCGGTHVHNTGAIGLFRIVHESSVASGVRRISAVAGEAAIAHIRLQEDLLNGAAATLKSSPGDINQAVERLQEALKEEKKRADRFLTQSASKPEAETVGKFDLVIQQLSDAKENELKALVDELVQGSAMRVAIAAGASGDKVIFCCKVSAEAVKAGANAGQIVKAMAQVCGGGGGGRPDFATAGGKDAPKLGEALAAAKAILESL